MKDPSTPAKPLEFKGLVEIMLGGIISRYPDGLRCPTLCELRAFWHPPQAEEESTEIRSKAARTLVVFCSQLPQVRNPKLSFSPRPISDAA